MAKTVLTLAMAFALALPNIAFADQKKPNKANFKEFSVTKSVDQASPTFFSARSGGSTGPTKPTLPATGGQRKQK